MNDQGSPRYRIALDDFRRARRKAALQDVISRITGHSDSLISFEEARKRLKAHGEEVLGLQEIPLAAIVGSVGRYADFNRNFLPRSSAQPGRWARVKSSLRDLDEMPPIQVYQIGEAYFVLDGNHRVSIARERGNTHIRAYVTEIHTKVPLESDTDFDDFILKAEYAAFLANTQIDEHCPQANLTITVPGNYKILYQQIQLHQKKLSTEQADISLGDAIRDWHKNTYLPVVAVIRKRGIMHGFPKRTETDLYVWLSKHRERIEEALGWSVDVNIVADDLVAEQGETFLRRLKRGFEKFRAATMPYLFESGPVPGEWRKRYAITHDSGSLFANILVPLSGEYDSWKALEQAIRIGQREKSHLLGLHITRHEADEERDAQKQIAERFERACDQAALEGEFALDHGKVAAVINKRARWADLVILHLAHPPQPQISSRLGSGLRDLIQRCPRPVMTVPQEAVEKIERILVAYDGSPKANESLYIAAYCAGRWDAKLTVLSVVTDANKRSWQIARAKYYLKQQGIEASYIKKEGEVAHAILETSDAENIDLILMGGYSRKPVAEVILGSALDEVLRHTRKPVLICR